jgi:membrane-associated protein
MELLFKTNEIIAWGGIVIILFLIFTETGLLLGLAIPGGESLVFTAGLLVSTGALDIPIGLFLLLMIIAGLLGDLCGYYIGKRLGSKLYRKKDTWYFKKKFLLGAETYLKKNSRSAMIAGKFLPVVRPFIPVLSGTTHVRFPFFFGLSAAACVIYFSCFLLTGYYLANQFPVLKDYIGWIVPLSILITIIIAVVQIRKLKGAA